MGRNMIQNTEVVTSPSSRDPKRRNVTVAVAAVAALGIVTLAGCAADPAPSQTATPTSTAAAPAPVPALAPQKVALDQLPVWVDTIGARDAAASGAPFIFAESTEGDTEVACHTMLRMPDGAIWIMNRPGAAPVAGVAMSPRRDLYGCGNRGFSWQTWDRLSTVPRPHTPSPGTPAAHRPEGVPDLAWFSTEVDLTAAGDSVKAGVPFIFAIPGGGVAACHTAVMLPDGKVWIMNKSGHAPLGGIPLNAEKKSYNCAQ